MGWSSTNYLGSPKRREYNEDVLGSATFIRTTHISRLLKCTYVPVFGIRLKYFIIILAVHAMSGQRTSNIQLSHNERRWDGTCVCNTCFAFEKMKFQFSFSISVKKRKKKNSYTYDISTFSKHSRHRHCLCWNGALKKKNSYNHKCHYNKKNTIVPDRMCFMKYTPCSLEINIFNVIEYFFIWSFVQQYSYRYTIIDGINKYSMC